MRYWRESDASTHRMQSYLCHHGIDGQKWGVKHGPPYPLDSSVSTGSKLKMTKDKNLTDKDNIRVRRAERKSGALGGALETRKILKEKKNINKQQQYLYDKHEEEVLDYLNKADIYNKKYRSLFDGYSDDRDEYAAIAGNIAFDTSPYFKDKTYDRERASIIWGYVNEDFDQGRDNSSNLYFLDKNRKNYDKFMDEFFKDKEAFDSSYRKLSNILKDKNKNYSVIERMSTLEKILKDNDLPEDLTWVAYEIERFPKSEREEALKLIDKYKNSDFDWETLVLED